MKKLITLCILSFLISLQTSCNLHIEKRRYNKGYHVELSQKQKNKTQVSSNITTNKKVEAKKNEAISLTNDTQNIPIDSLKAIPVVSSHITTDRPNPTKPLLRIIHRDDKCDIIRLLNGTEIEVMIQNIDKKEVSYRKCNDPDRSIYKIPTKNIQEITLTNGKTYKPMELIKSKGGSSDYANITGGMIGGIILAAIALICIIVAIGFIFGSTPFGLYTAIPLAIAGIASLIGFLWSSKFLEKGAHALGKVSFIVNIIMQILAIIFTVLMFMF